MKIFLMFSFLASIVISLNSYAGVKEMPDNWHISSQDMSFDVSKTTGQITNIIVNEEKYPDNGGPFVVDLTLTKNKSVSELTDNEMESLGISTVDLDNLQGIFSSPSGPIYSLQIGNISEDMYLFKIVFEEDYSSSGTIRIYLDRDNDPSTGRKDYEGMDFLMVAGEVVEGVYRRPYGHEYFWTADGTLKSENKPALGVIKEKIIYLVCKVGFTKTGKIASGRICVATETSETAVPPFSFSLEVKEKKTDMRLLKPTDVILKDNQLMFTQRTADGKTAVVSEVIPETKCINWKLTLINNDNIERNYKMGIELPFYYKDSWSYWDGFSSEETNNLSAEKSYSGISSTFPLGCIYSGGKGLAAGIEPKDLVCLIENGVSQISGEIWRFRYGIRAAIGSESQATVNIIIFGFNEKYGYLDAVQKYYDISPSVFDIASGVNPYFKGIGLYNLYWQYSYRPELPFYSGELIRRLGYGEGGWEWGYTYSVPGDWGLMHVDEYRNASAFNNLKEKYDGGTRSMVAVSYYINPQWCEQTLAKKRFSDSIFDLGLFPNSDELTNEWKGGAFTTIKLFSSGNEWGRSLTSSINHIVKEYAPSAIAFDSASGFVRDYGVASKNAPSRAFDDIGRSYSIEGIGFSQLMDVVHGLTNSRGEKVGVVTNLKLVGIFSDAFRSDAILFEENPMTQPDYERCKRLRLLTGKKTIVWWMPIDPKGIKWVKWDELNPQEIIDALRYIRDGMLLYSVHLGAIPSAAQVVGVEKIYSNLPLIYELANSGWQPSPKSLVGENKLLVSRFGDDLHGYYSIVNMHKDRFSTKFEADSFGDKKVILVDINGGTTENEIAKETTSTNILLKDLSFKVFSKSAWISGLPEKTRVSATYEDRKFMEKILKMKINYSKSVPVTCVFPVPPKYIPHELIVMGGEVEFEYNKESRLISCNFRTSDKTTDVNIVYKPLIDVTGNLGDLYSMDFFGKDSNNLIIVKDNIDDEDYGYPAWRIQEYFRFYSKRVLGMKSIEIPIYNREEDSTKPHIMFILKSIASQEKTSGKIEIYKNKIVITGDKDTLGKAVLKFLSMLDKKYIYYGKFSALTEFNFFGYKSDPFTDKAGLSNSTLKGEIGEPR